MPAEPNRKTRPDGPRRVRNGLRLKRKDGNEPWTWPATPWAERLVGSPQPAVMNLALEYGRLGQTTILEVTPGRLFGKVQCQRAKPHEVTIDFPALAEAAWTRVLQRTAAEAIYAAKLLAGEFPEIVGEPFEETGHPLVPKSEDIRISCTCDQPTQCHHQLVVALLLLERLQEYPELALELRGRSGERFRSDLQEVRMLATRGVSQAHTNPDVVRLAGPIRSIESRLGEFWRPGAMLEASREGSMPKHVPHALLRRLGSSPLEGRFPITGLLASIYDTVAEEARHIRDAAERADDVNSEDPPPQAPSGDGGAAPYSCS